MGRFLRRMGMEPEVLLFLVLAILRLGLGRRLGRLLRLLRRRMGTPSPLRALLRRQAIQQLWRLLREEQPEHTLLLRRFVGRHKVFIFPFRQQPERIILFL